MITNYLRDLSESRVFCNSYPVWKYYDVLYPVVLLRIKIFKQGADPATGIAPDKFIETRDCSPLFKIYICVLPEKYANI